MFLTPIDFFDFYIGAWNSCVPVKTCKAVNGTVAIDPTDLKNKLKVYGYSILKNMITNLCGHAISVKYLPSMIAAKALEMAMQTILKREKHTDIKEKMSETMKICGVRSLSPIKEQDLSIIPFLNALSGDESKLYLLQLQNEEDTFKTPLKTKKVNQS